MESSEVPEHRKGYKLGANYSDQRMIKRLAKQGHTAEKICDALHITLSCVESFAADPKAAVPGQFSAQKAPDMPAAEDPLIAELRAQNQALTERVEKAEAPEPEPEVEETEDEPEIDLEE